MSVQTSVMNKRLSENQNSSGSGGSPPGPARQLKPYLILHRAVVNPPSLSHSSQSASLRLSPSVVDNKYTGSGSFRSEFRVRPDSSLSSKPRSNLNTECWFNVPGSRQRKYAPRWHQRIQRCREEHRWHRWRCHSRNRPLHKVFEHACKQPKISS